MRILLSLLIFVFTLVFSTHADVSIPLDIECCISINEKLDEQTDILKLQYELNAKDKQVINKIYEKVTDTPSADMTYKDWFNIIGTLFGSLLGAVVAILVFKRGIKHEKEKEEEKKRSLLKVIALSLDNIEKKCKTKVQYIEEYNDSVHKKPWEHSILKINTIDEAIRIKSLNVDYVFDAFYEFKIDEKYYIKLHPHLDYIYDLFKSLDNDYSNHSHQYITTPSNEILKINEQIQNESVFLATDLDKNPSLVILANPIWEIIKSYNEKIKENKTNIDFIIKNSIDPLLHLYINEKYLNIPTCRQLLPPLKHSKALYDSICEYNILFASQVLSKKESIINCANIFNDIKIQINKQTGNQVTFNENKTKKEELSDGTITKG